MATASNRGAVVSVRGSVVDVRFDQRLPPILSVLHAGTEGEIVVEVMEQLDARRVRGIALTLTQGLARGTPVEDTGEPLQAPQFTLQPQLAYREGSFIFRLCPSRHIEFVTRNSQYREFVWTAILLSQLHRSSQPDSPLASAACVRRWARAVQLPPLSHR